MIESVYDETKRLVQELQTLQELVTQLQADMISVQSGFISGSGSAIFALDFVKGTCFAILSAVGGVALAGGAAATVGSAATASFFSKLLETSADAGGKAWAGTKVPSTWEILWEALKAAVVSVAGNLFAAKWMEKIGTRVTNWLMTKTDVAAYLIGMSDSTREYILKLAFEDLPKGVCEELVKTAISELETRLAGKKPSSNSFFGEVAKGLVQGSFGDKVKARVAQEGAGAVFDEKAFAAKVLKAVAKLP